MAPTEGQATPEQIRSGRQLATTHGSEQALQAGARATELQGQAGGAAGVPAAQGTGPGARVASLHAGSRGPEVNQLQQQLNDVRHQNGQSNIAVDGQYGRQTQAAVRDFQGRAGITPNGIANAQTRERLALESNPQFQHLNTDTRNQVGDMMNRYRTNPAARTNLQQIATDPNFSQLSRAHQDQVLQTFNRNPGNDVATRNLQQLYGSENFRHMDDALKTRTLNLAAAGGGTARINNDLQRMVGNPTFGRMNTAQQTQMLNVFENTTPSGRTALNSLQNRQINGQPALLTRGYGNTGTLLDQLNRASTTNVDSRLVDSAGQPVPRSRVTEQLLQEVSDPARRINQDNRGTCTVTSHTYALAQQNPAEYARLSTDLATTGQSRLANGDTIRVPAQNGAWQADNSDRSHGERLLQSALMDYARPGQNYQNWNAGADGQRGTADDGFPDPTNPNNRSIDGWPDTNGSGLIPSEQQRVLSGLHGRQYQQVTGSGQDVTARAQQELQAGRQVHTDLAWGGGQHAVVITRIDQQNGRVYFRNPWGADGVGQNGAVNGTAANNTGTGPLRTTTNGDQAEESISLQDYQRIQRGIYVPQQQ